MRVPVAVRVSVRRRHGTRGPRREQMPVHAPVRVTVHEPPVPVPDGGRGHGSKVPAGVAPVPLTLLREDCRVAAILEAFSLAGRRAMITGGSRGLGLEIALGLAQAGADLVLVGRERASLDAAAERAAAFGVTVATLVGDLWAPDQAETTARRALAEHGPIDILVNNVGGRRVNLPTEAMPTDTWRMQLDLNVTSAFVSTKIIGGEMVKRRSGRIVNVASISGLISNRGITGRGYEAGKPHFAFTRAVAADWAPHGVNVNAIAPGIFLTDPNRRWFGQNPKLRETIESKVPIGRLRPAATRSRRSPSTSRATRRAHDRRRDRDRRRLHALVIAVWGREDSNLRRLRQRVYSPSPWPLGNTPGKGRHSSGGSLLVVLDHLGRSGPRRRRRRGPPRATRAAGAAGPSTGRARPSAPAAGAGRRRSPSPSDSRCQSSCSSSTSCSIVPWICWSSITPPSVGAEY